MKKLIVAIVALLYISTSTGAPLYLHYCMGNPAGWGFGDNNSKTCGGCGMEKSEEKDNGCCKDEHTFLKNDSDQKVTTIGFQMIQLLAVVLPVSSIEMSITDFLSITEENPVNHAPPRTIGVAVYIRNCFFLI
jgi:hypothetical protein